MERNVKLRLGTGMRLQWEAAQSAYVMLYPEGMIRLNEPAGHILSRCDGRTVDALITDLEAMFPDVELADDVIAFLDEADAKGWLRTEGEDHG